MAPASKQQSLFDDEEATPGADATQYGRQQRYFPRRLLTDSELQFFKQLQAAVPEYHVCPQVCMGALIDPKKKLYGWVRRQARQAYHNRMVDFTIFDVAAGRVVCLVELDDWSHDGRRALAKDEYRDGMTGEAGYHTLRWDVRNQPSQAVIRAEILGKAAAPPKAFIAPAVRHQPSPPPNAVPEFVRASPRPNPSERAATLFVACLLVLIAGSLVLTSIVPWVTRQFVGSVTGKAPSVPKAANDTYRVVLKPGAAVMLTVAQCVAYGDQQVLKQRAAQGCSPVEKVEFEGGVNEAAFRQWAQFNASRLSTAAACAAYPGWAQDIVQDAAFPLGQRLAQLQSLYADALVKGCLKAPA